MVQMRKGIEEQIKENLINNTYVKHLKIPILDLKKQQQNMKN